jgi:hypothetical protein
MATLTGFLSLNQVEILAMFGALGLLKVIYW